MSVALIAAFLTPYEAVRLLSRLSKGVRTSFNEQVHGAMWPAPHILSEVIEGNPIDWIRGQLGRTYSFAASEVFLVLLVDPIWIYRQRATNDDCLGHILCRRGDAGLFQLLARMSPLFDPNERGAGSMTFLHCGAFARCPEVCRFLATCGASADIRDDMKRLPEDWATIQQAHDLATFLRHIRKGKTFNSSPTGCMSWLHSS